MKNFYQRTLTSLMALSLVAMSGCSSDTTTSGGQTGTASASGEVTTVELWHYYNDNTKNIFDSLVAEFNSTVGAEKNIAVVASSYSSVSDLGDAVVSSANQEVNAGDMPHIFAAYTDTALLIDQLGLVANMDDYFTAEELALFQQDFLVEGRFTSDESLKIIPVAKSTELLFVNETDFALFADETGSDMSQMTTWEGLAEISATYYDWTDGKTPDVPYDGKALFGIDSQANFMLIASMQLGEEIYIYGEDSVSFGLGEDNARKIWEVLMVPYIYGHYANYSGYRSGDVSTGDLLAYVGSTSSVNHFPEVVEVGRSEAYEIQGVALPYPYFANCEPIAVQQGAGMVVSKTDSTHEAAAAEFLKWFTFSDNNLEFAGSTGYIPVQNDALTLEGILEQQSGDLNSITQSALGVIYDEMLPNYEFYTNKPFDGSYATRTAIAAAVSDNLAQYIEARELFEETGNPEHYEEAMAVLTNEDAFQIWYNLLTQAVEENLN